MVKPSGRRGARRAIYGATADFGSGLDAARAPRRARRRSADGGSSPPSPASRPAGRRLGVDPADATPRRPARLRRRPGLAASACRRGVRGASARTRRLGGRRWRAPQPDATPRLGRLRRRAADSRAIFLLRSPPRGERRPRRTGATTASVTSASARPLGLPSPARCLLVVRARRGVPPSRAPPVATLDGRLGIRRPAADWSGSALRARLSPSAAADLVATALSLRPSGSPLD